MATLVKKGKTKDVFKLEDGTGNYVLRFKDDVTGANGVVDPGANQVIGKELGMGAACLRMSTHFFEKVKPWMRTHYVSSNFDDGTMIVTPVKLFGPGLEFIVRFIATGSFVKRYSKYGAKDGATMDQFVEICIKDDEGGDPVVGTRVLEHLGFATREQLKFMEDAALDVAAAVRDDMEAKGLTLYDIKVEFGQNDEGQVILIDEISPGSMRVYKGEMKLSGLELAKVFLGE